MRLPTLSLSFLRLESFHSHSTRDFYMSNRESFLKATSFKVQIKLEKGFAGVLCCQSRTMTTFWFSFAFEQKYSWKYFSVIQHPIKICVIRSFSRKLQLTRKNDRLKTDLIFNLRKFLLISLLFETATNAELKHPSLPTGRDDH